MPRTLARLLTAVTIACLIAVPLTASSHSGSGSHSSHSKAGTKSKSTSGASHTKSSSSSSSGTVHHKSSTAKRDSHGRIVRSEATKHQFEVQTGYPHGRPGYVVDHIKPLACGGADV